MDEKRDRIRELLDEIGDNRLDERMWTMAQSTSDEQTLKWMISYLERILGS